MLKTLIAIAIMLLTACSDPTEPEPLILGGLTVTTSAPISGQAGAPITISLRATSTTNVGMPNQAISLTVTGGGGTVATSSVVNDAQGNASAAWILGAQAGTNTLLATAGTFTQVVSATGTAGPAAKVGIATAPSSSPRSRIAFAQQPSVRILDTNNNQVSQAGTMVTAQLTSGSGTLIGATMATTNAAGVATFTNLAVGGAVGIKTLSFSGSGLASATANITLTAGVPVTITALSGNNQTAPTMSILPTALAVRVNDADLNGVGGTVVTFTAPVGAPVNGTTANDGTASVTFRVGVLPGQYSVTASAAGLTGSPVTFVATATPPTVCAPVTLTLEQVYNANLQAGPCAFQSLLDPNPYTGPHAGGTHFFDAYRVDVPAGAIVRIDVTLGTLGAGFNTYNSGIYDNYGNRVVDGPCCSDPLVVNNASSATARSFFIVIIGFTAGTTGTYSLMSRRIF